MLLQHLQDTRAGLWDGRAEGGGASLMCSVWNSPAYQRLERLLPRLRSAEPLAWPPCTRFSDSCGCPQTLELSLSD